jgi:SARP family transcriptional regulator, regulator of embCAB operon
MDLSNPARANSQARPQLALVGGFRLLADDAVANLPLGAQRLLAFLALHDVPLLRGYVAEALWPDSRRRRAAANLRSAIWRIRQTNPDIVQVTNSHLSLKPEVGVDVRELRVTAFRLVQRSSSIRAEDLQPGLIEFLSMKLLSDWFDEWLMLEHDRWNQLRMHALEALAERLMEVGDFSLAVEAALAAVWAEPLRESAHRALMRIHAAEGNWCEVLAQYRRYRQLLQRELKASPTPQMEQLIRELTPY